ncbi:hypothetical protein QR680_018846 [Steinernema hermaphroditum]|uniref:Uncharacterized protein n=1 Tax=Steinernema hermaphroditum TaxID=289476 RepID=A0AA39HLG0_9BILA|nr:hypothetical protein QR680_018846 [Steinernema hermaphroditum]
MHEGAAVQIDPNPTTVFYPIIHPSPNFFCCFERYHITLVAKVLSIVHLFVYLLVLVLIFKSGTAVTLMFSILLTASVSICTIYGTFRWSKLCLLPFFMLQGILLLYMLVMLAMLVYSVFAHNSYIYLKLRDYVEFKWRIATESVLLAMLYVLLLVILAMAYASQLMWHEYQFIAEVDEFLKTTRRPSSGENGSHDGNSGNHVHPSQRKQAQPLVIV